MQIFHNTIMAGLIHKTITKALITKLFGLHHLQLVKKRLTVGGQIKKFTFSPFPIQLSTAKVFFPVVRQPCP